jgi:hypothetical protein
VRREDPQSFDRLAEDNDFLASLPLVARLRGMLRPGGRLAIVDNVHRTPHVAPYILWGAPALDLSPDVFRHGPRAALRRLRICWGRAWRAHLASDRFLSEAGFRALYGAALPGASFRRLGVFMSVVWTRE